MLISLKALLALWQSLYFCSRIYWDWLNTSSKLGIMTCFGTPMESFCFESILTLQWVHMVSSSLRKLSHLCLWHCLKSHSKAWKLLGKWMEIMGSYQSLYTLNCAWAKISKTLWPLWYIFDLKFIHTVKL